MEAVTPQVKAENISKILYPEDSTKVGKELRLEQQYFFVSASLHDAIRVFYPGQDLSLIHIWVLQLTKAPTLLSGHRVGAMRFVVEHLRTSAFVGTSALSARSMPLSYP